MVDSRALALHIRRDGACERVGGSGYGRTTDFTSIGGFSGSVGLVLVFSSIPFLVFMNFCLGAVFFVFVGRGVIEDMIVLFVDRIGFVIERIRSTDAVGFLLIP